jgi:periplasmic copper chaperone A
MFRIAFAIALLSSIVVAPAASAQVSVSDAWVRATVPAQRASGAFMTLRSAQPARLISASSPVAGVVEIHEMKMEGDTMRMRAIDALALPAGQSVELAPGGYHVMLMELKQTLKEGDTVPLSLTIEAEGKRSTVEVAAPVRKLAEKKHQHH